MGFESGEGLVVVSVFGHGDIQKVIFRAAGEKYNSAGIYTDIFPMLTPTLGEILDNQQMDPTDSQL
jgi:hypothetical protein